MSYSNYKQMYKIFPKLSPQMKLEMSISDIIQYEDIRNKFYQKKLSLINFFEEFKPILMVQVGKQYFNHFCKVEKDVAYFLERLEKTNRDANLERMINKRMKDEQKTQRFNTITNLNKNNWKFQIENGQLHVHFYAKDGNLICIQVKSLYKNHDNYCIKNQNGNMYRCYL